MARIVITLVIFIFFVLKANAQAVGNVGCKIPGQTVVYNVPETGAVNALLGILLGNGYRGPTVPETGVCVSNSQLVYKQVGNTNCRVCPTGFSISGISLLCNGALSTGTPGKEVTAGIVQCNLDDYTWAFGAVAGVFGVFVIRRRNKA